MGPVRSARAFAAALILWAALPVAARAAGSDCPASLAGGIPPRSEAAPGGAEFAASVAHEDARGREIRIEHEILRGNLPAFMRQLQPVALRADLPDGRTVTATLCVMPDYLGIGADGDFLRIPMSLHTAAEIATQFGFVLPTRKMVDAIYLQSAVHLRPQPLPAGPQMRSTDYYCRHDRSIRAQCSVLQVPLGVLISGHKKDIVLSNRLANHPGRIAIYGWHEPDGQPIQPLSTFHGANYVDYSHGIRLVSDIAFLDGAPASLHDLLEDPRLACVVSDEGPVAILPQLIPENPAVLARLGFARPGGTSLRAEGDTRVLQLPPF